MSSELQFLVRSDLCPGFVSFFSWFRTFECIVFGNLCQADR
uniref:Uncharacterized protein n=1 Tax=Rhizophora mucronata TaxID=61149 RepID=A0A2P2J0Q5_RHIMU